MDLDASLVARANASAIERGVAHLVTPHFLTTLSSVSSVLALAFIGGVKWTFISV
jgi:hypothetical protein